MLANDTSLIKNLKKNLCTRIFNRELDFSGNKIQIYLFVRDLKVVGDKIFLSGIRIAGHIHYAGIKKPKEIAEVSYKIKLQKDGITSLLVTQSVWAVLETRLKHYNIGRANVTIKGDPSYLFTKRFFKHIKIYIPPT